MNMVAVNGTSYNRGDRTTWTLPYGILDEFESRYLAGRPWPRPVLGEREGHFCQSEEGGEIERGRRDEFDGLDRTGKDDCGCL